jgi:exopolysaccharide biosynthesis polyprenyl glycosylphosphotransferase
MTRSAVSSGPTTRISAIGLTGRRSVPRTRAAAIARTQVLVMPLTDVLALGVAITVTWSGPQAIAYGAAVLAVLSASGTHRLRICLRVSDQAGRIAAAAVVPLPVLLGWLPGAAAFGVALWSAALLAGCRVAAAMFLRAAHRRGLLTEPTLIVGTGETGVLIARLLHEHPELGLRPLGFLDSWAESCSPRDQELPLPVLGAPAELPALTRHLQVRRVIVCFPVDRDRDLVGILRTCRSLPADICVVPRLQELGAALPRASLDEIWGVPLVPLRRDYLAGPVLKRAFDLIVATALLCACGPALLVLAAAIRVLSGRPAVFRQLRVTGTGRNSMILKLRTLEAHADSDTCWTVPSGRCTALGRRLRPMHIDELPQLVNVLRGEMSLVGPRPERLFFAEQFASQIPGYADRTRMPAGLTGLAQASGLHGDTSMRDRVRFDNLYIEYWSPWLDVVVLARTLCGALRQGVRGQR